MKNFRRNGTTMILLATLFCLTLMPSVALSNAPSVSIDGQTITLPANNGTPFVDAGNRLQVPLKFVEKLGAKVTWNNQLQTATINGKIKVKVGDSKIQTASGTVAMDTKAIMKSNRVYVPIKYLSNALGYKIVASTQNGHINANIITKANLTISAAASLKDAMNEVKVLYLKEKPHYHLNLNFGSSGSLEQQIEQGADVDLFFSASTGNMNTLKDKGLLQNNSVTNLLGNKLVLITPKDSKIKLKGFADVLDPSVKKVALGEPKSVPVGQYAEDVFNKLNILSQVKAKAVYGKDVKEVLTWVETGNVEAGVVYSTDAKVSSKVIVAATAPANSHKPIVYPVAVIKATHSSEAANDFLNFLKSDAAKAIFEKYGFSIL